METKFKSRTRPSQWQPLGTFNGKAKRQRDLFDFGQNPPSVVGKHSSCKGGAPGAPKGLGGLGIWVVFETLGPP